MAGPRSSGGAWINADKGNDPSKEKWPDLKGGIDVTEDQIRSLLDMHKRGMVPRLQLAVWNRTAQESGNHYLYIASEVFVPEQQQGQPQYQQQPQQGGGFRQPQQQQPPGYNPQPSQTQPQQYEQPSDGFDDDSIPF